MSIDKLSMISFRDEYTGILTKQANPFKGFIKNQVKTQLKKSLSGVKSGVKSVATQGNKAFNAGADAITATGAALNRGTAALGSSVRKGVQNTARAGLRTNSKLIAGGNNMVQGYKAGIRGKNPAPSNLMSVPKGQITPVSGGISPNQSIPALTGTGAGRVSRIGAISLPGVAVGAEMAQPGAVTGRVGNVINKAGRKLSEFGNRMSTKGLKAKPGLPA